MNPYEREIAHLRHVISTAKIVVTLTAGIAVTFVAAELQGTESKCWESAAAIFTVPMLGATLGILMLRAPCSVARRSRGRRSVQGDEECG
jgi:hypothetical protein